MAPLLDVPIPGTTSRAEDTLPAWMCLTTPEGASSPRNMPQALNRTSWHISQFQLGKPLYQGKTSSLYMAQDKPSRMPVAIKCYHKRRLNTLNMRQVERELLIHLDLKHRNIIKLYAAFEDKRTVYLVLEPAACDVFHKLKQTRVMDEASSWDIVRQCLQACSYLHAKGVIHRDIKPENLLCISASDTIELRLADFGLAIDSRKERPVTRLGTLDFMAPEVLRSPEKRSPEEYKDRSDMAYTTAVDVWAIGVLACELLTGSAPFARKTRLETMDNILRGQLVVPAGVPPKAADFIQAALCKDAKSRPSVEQLLQHTWMKERPAPAPAPPPQQVPPGPEPSSRTPEASPGPESKLSTPGSSPGPELMPHTPGASPGPESKPSTPGTSLGPELVPRTPAIVSVAAAPGMVTCTEPATPATPMAPVAPLAAGKSRRLATKGVEPGAAAAAAAAGGATEALHRCSSTESKGSAGPRAPSVTSAEEAQPQPVTSAASATPQNGAASLAAAALAATAASIAAAATTPSNAMRASTVSSSFKSSAGPGLVPTGSKQPAGPSTPQQPVASRPSQPRPNAARGLQGTDASPSTQAAAVGMLARKHAAVQPPTAATLPKAGAAAAPATAVLRQGVPGASSPATTADGISPGHAGQRVNKDAGPGTAQLVPLLAPQLPRPEPNALLCSPRDVELHYVVQPSCISAPSNTILADTCFLRRDSSWAAKTLASTSASQLFTSPLDSMEMQAPASVATAALGRTPLPQPRATAAAMSAAGVQRAAAGGAARAVPALRLPLHQPSPVTEAAASTAMLGVVGVLGSHQRQGLTSTLGSVYITAMPGAMASPRQPRPPPAGVLCDEPPPLASPRGAPGPFNKPRASLDIGRSAPVVNKESRPWTTTPISRGSTQELSHAGSVPGCTAPAQPPPAASFRSASRRLHVNCNPIGNEALRSSTAVDTPAQGAPNRLCPGLTSSPRVSAAEERRPADTWAVPVVAGPWASAGRQQHQEQQQQQGQQRQGGRQQQLSADESQSGLGDGGAVSPLLNPAEFFGMKLKSFTGKFGPSSDRAAAAPLLPSTAMFAPNTSWLFFKRSKPAAANAVSARTKPGGSAADPPRQQPDNDMSHESRALLDTHTVP